MQRQRTARHSRSVALLLALVAAFVPWRNASGHEIPGDVTVRAFVAPEGQRLRLLVRAPLEAMRDFQFPTWGPGYLDLEGVQPMLGDAAVLWIANYLTLWEDGRALGEPEVVATRVSLPSDPSFRSWETALSHMSAPRLPARTGLPWRQATLDVLFEYDIRTDRSRFAIEPELAHLGLRTLTVVAFRPPDGPERLFQFTGNPGRVTLDPRWHQAAWRFVKLGFHHILDGLDHLLFLLCLVVPLRRVDPLIPVVTAFTVAHSITLIASALGLAPSALWFPPLIETLIALSIVYMAFENIAGARLNRRWTIAFAFGLIHGFGFSFLLRESLQFAGGHLLTSLLAFNVGVELGQVFVLLLAVPVLALIFRRVVRERLGVILISALLAHTGWHWMTQRGSELLQYRFTWPAVDAALGAALLRWVILALVVAGSAWALSAAIGWWRKVSLQPLAEGS